MLTNEEVTSLPEDPMLAFVEYEGLLRTRLEQYNEQYTPSDWDKEREYVTHVLAFVDVHDLQLDIPSDPPGDDKEFGAYFKSLKQKVDFWRSRLQLQALRNIPSAHQMLVHLSDDFREEIHNLINRIRKIIASSDLSEKKKNSIYDRIASLSREVDKSTTRVEDLTSIWLDVTYAAGQGFKNLDPALKSIEKIAGIIGNAKAENEEGRLLPNEEQKLLEAPDSSDGPTSDDDEIPF